MKPLGIKSYGSIPHLPGSRRGPGDHGLSDRQASILTEKVRDKKDCIIVTEKLDGSCVAVTRKEGNLLALGRAGYLAQSSKYEQHQLFAAWVRWNEGLFDWLQEGMRVCGEWMIQAHGTKYIINQPFFVFDVFSAENQRLSQYEWLIKHNPTIPLPFVPLIYCGSAAFPIERAMSNLGEYGALNADKAEGCVWRVERDGKYDFMGKYVRPDKKDGIYLECETGGEPIWNIDPRSLCLSA